MRGCQLQIGVCSFTRYHTPERIHLDDKRARKPTIYPSVMLPKGAIFGRCANRRKTMAKGLATLNDKSSPVIVWFRQDLRLADNPALHAARQTGQPLICIYISMT